jgi:hypothetical protein
MKKKLKVKKAFAGKMMKAAPAQARRVIVPQRPILGRPPTRSLIPSTVVNPVRPGMQQQGLQIINGVKQLPDPSTIGSNIVPRPMQPSSQIDPSSPRSLPFASAAGPQQTPMQQQAAPVQPVPAMKKGGMVRGQGAAIRGTKFKGIF